MKTLHEKVRDILKNSDFNDLPIDERRKIAKYMQEQQILTIWQMIENNKDHTTAAWRKKQTKWLANCVESYRKSYDEMVKRGLNK